MFQARKPQHRLLAAVATHLDRGAQAHAHRRALGPAEQAAAHIGVQLHTGYAGRLAVGMPGMGELIDGAVQQAAQWERQCIGRSQEFRGFLQYGVFYNTRFSPF